MAIARALVTNPEMTVLDEPLSNLDAKLRVQLRNELKDLQKRFGIPTVYVSPMTRKMTLSDRIPSLTKGVIEQMAARTRSTATTGYGVRLQLYR